MNRQKNHLNDKHTLMYLDQVFFLHLYKYSSTKSTHQHHWGYIKLSIFYCEASANSRKVQVILHASFDFSQRNVVTH